MSWSRKSRHERGYGSLWEKIRKRVLDRDSGLCQACTRKGRVALGREVHHKTPRAQGGRDEDSNLETLCHECHLEAAVVRASADGDAAEQRDEDHAHLAMAHHAERRHVPKFVQRHHRGQHGRQDEAAEA